MRSVLGVKAELCGDFVSFIKDGKESRIYGTDEHHAAKIKAHFDALVQEVVEEINYHIQSELKYLLDTGDTPFSRLLTHDWQITAEDLRK